MVFSMIMTLQMVDFVSLLVSLKKSGFVQTCSEFSFVFLFFAKGAGWIKRPKSVLYEAELTGWNAKNWPKWKAHLACVNLIVNLETSVGFLDSITLQRTSIFFCFTCMKYWGRVISLNNTILALSPQSEHL